MCIQDTNVSLSHFFFNFFLSLMPNSTKSNCVKYRKKLRYCDELPRPIELKIRVVVTKNYFVLFVWMISKQKFYLQIEYLIWSGKYWNRLWFQTHFLRHFLFLKLTPILIIFFASFSTFEIDDRKCCQPTFCHILAVLIRSLNSSLDFSFNSILSLNSGGRCNMFWNDIHKGMVSIYTLWTCFS